MKTTSRKSTVGAGNGRTTVGNFSTRFSLPSFIKRVEKLTDCQKTAIKNVGFGNLLDMPNLTLNKNLLVELMERWNCERNAFVLLSREITIDLMDVALIMGLRVRGKTVILRQDEPFSDLEKEYGATLWMRKITVASIESRLEALGGIVSDDFIRSFLLFTFGTFLFPNANAKVDSRYLALLKDLDNLDQSAWGAAVLKDISMWLTKRKENNVQYVGGCLLFLQIWSYEHIDIARPNLVDCNLTFPRACRWENGRSRQRQWLATKFKELQENQIIWNLHLTSEELNKDVVKELLEAEDGTIELSSQEHSSADTSVLNIIRPQRMDQHVIELLDSESDMEIVREDEEGDVEQVTVSQDVRVLPINTSEHSSRFQCLLEKQKEHNDDDLRTRNRMLEEQITELKKQIDELRSENKQLKIQLSSGSLLEGQNVELKKEVDELRQENQILSSSANNLVFRLEKLIFEEDINSTEET